MQHAIKNTIRRGKRFIRFLLGKDILQGSQIRIQTEQYGSDHGVWAVAANELDENSIVYSFGVGDDISFDLALIERYNATVHAFDPTPLSVNWVKKQSPPNQFVFHPYGVTDYDGHATFYAPSNPDYVSYTLLEEQRPQQKNVRVPVRRLTTILDELGHEYIDLLKMDIEGAEYNVIRSLLHEEITVNQLLVEFHHRFASVNVQQTKNAIEALNRKGYKIFHVSPDGREFSLIRH